MVTTVMVTEDISGSYHGTRDTINMGKMFRHCCGGKDPTSTNTSEVNGSVSAQKWLTQRARSKSLRLFRLKNG